MRSGRAGSWSGSARARPVPYASRVSASGSEATTVTLVEANLDDLNSQRYGYVMERLFAAGALDVTLTPIQMKKNRCRRAAEAHGVPLKEVQAAASAAVRALIPDVPR